MIKTKLFTLIELLITIVVIGVLAAIVVPNISNFKQESTTAAMQANIKNIETALTMYSLENNGALPISGEPEIGLPEPLLLDEMHPDFLRSLPKVNSMKYWVDYTDKVWASSADSPVGIIYTTEGKLKWEDAENAVSYNIFIAENHKVTSKASNKRVTFLENVTDLEVELPKLEEGEFYLVNSVDQFNLESPPVNGNYQQNLGEENDTGQGRSQVEDFELPFELEKVSWKNEMTEMNDKDMSTYVNLGSNEYVFEWEGEMTNRVFKITYETHNFATTIYRNFEFLDAQGNKVPFIEAQTDRKHSTFNARNNWSKRTSEFVVPKGAVAFKVYSGTLGITIYEAAFVDDLSLPYPVEHVTSEVTGESMTLNWLPPANDDNFWKVAIYEDELFLGYSDNGSFTVPSLYANQEYKFLLEPISVVGNRGPRVEHTNVTARPNIVWSGLNNARAFDSSLTTYAEVQTGSIVRWEGDLTNRQLTFTAQSNSGSYGRTAFFSFYNHENQVIPSKQINNETLISSFKWTTSSTKTLTYSVLIPEGASYIKFTSTNATYYLFDLRISD